MSYTKKTWNGLPDTTTPVNATGMNDLETRIDALNTSIINMIGLATSSEKSIPNNKRLSGPDLNSVSGTGLFVAYGPCTNVPMYDGVSTSHWYLLQIEHNNNSKVQMIERLAGTGEDFFVRTKVSGTWNNWKCLTPVKIASSNITASIGSLSLNNSCVMPNDFVSLNLKFTGVSVSTTGTNVLATLSSGYYGTQEIGLIAIVNDGTFTNCWLRNNGEIVIQPSRTFSNKEVRIIGNYSI